MSEIIRVENLSYIYNLGMPDATKALDDVSFTVEEGDFVGIIGSTGSGKSTLISHFNGLNRPTSGRVLVDGKDLWEQGADLRSETLAQRMNPSPKTISPEALAAEAARRMEDARISQMLVVEDGRLVGALHMHDLMRAKVL